MHISVAKFGGDEELLTIEIAPDLSLQDLKAVIESESDFGIKTDEMNLYHDARGDPSSPGAASRLNASTNSPELEQLFNQLRSTDPGVRQQLRGMDPQLVDAIEHNDFNAFTQSLTNRAASRAMQRPPEVDYLDPRIQERIEQAINMENVIDNMEHAYEHAPEFFGNVVMLYINCKVNGHAIKAFVDSGAQMTIMSKSCAERCGIMRLVDTRFSGIARGVGTQNILGRVHIAQLEVEKQFFQTSLSVLEEQSIDMLIGLDMLRRHRCVIDLDKNVLRIENSVETSFLPESELPLHARLTGNTPDIENSPTEPPLRSTTQSSRRTSTRTDNRRQQRSDQPLPSAAAGAAALPLTPSPFPEKDVKEITKKGFTREQAIEELKATNGDVTRALVTLIAKNLSIPKPKK